MVDLEWVDLEWVDLEWVDLEWVDLEWVDLEWVDLEWGHGRCGPLVGGATYTSGCMQSMKFLSEITLSILSLITSFKLPMMFTNLLVVFLTS